MKKEIYAWIVIILVILSVALYVRLFYQPTISLVLSTNASETQQLFPYQKVVLGVSVLNNGDTPIDNMSIGVLINGNVTTLYKIILPAGKETEIVYNYSPSAAGNYNLSFVADPGKLYDIADRARSQVSVVLDVVEPQNASAYSLLPAANITSLEYAEMNSPGYAVSSVVAGEYGFKLFNLTDNTQLNGFLSPIFNVTIDYIKNVSIAKASYSDGLKMYSIWIRGYLAPDIFALSTSALAGIKPVQTVTNAGNTTFIEFGNYTTFCSVYSGGWLKALAVVGNETCVSALNSTAQTVATPPATVGALHPNSTLLQSLSDIGLYSGYQIYQNSSSCSNGTTACPPTKELYSGVLLAANITPLSFVYAGVWNNSLVPESNTCFGVPTNVSGTNYCSTFIFPTSGKIGNVSLIRTTAFVNSYNISAFSFVNTSHAIDQVPVAVAILKTFNISGASVPFAYGFVNTCSFNDSFSCSNLTFVNGTVGFKLEDNMSKSVQLNSISCYSDALTTLQMPLNISLASGESNTLQTGCYSIVGKITGVPIGLRLNLRLNYTVTNSTYTLIGNASIPFG